ncbi:MAG: hypothetical protein A3G75_10540 [Verrucomicrobia bacterium RIFCSPLOWO2_12_FULL_64_8]|nr:MAG: hypothetical protein A3G75_10540 [Verrucomicrobia bacterium RIFCSPLOWO2_12_FULL_64_8]
MFSTSPSGGNRKLRLAAAAVLALAALLPAACDRAEPAGPVEPKTINERFAIHVGDRSLRLHLAIHEAEMQRGLMGRRDLAPDEGMLFVYPRPAPMSFWMRNTPLALDIAFFDPEGELKEVYALQPFDENPVRSRGLHLQFAIETNQGWFHENGVKPGAKLELAAVRRALEARGAKPSTFGLTP